MSLVGREKRWPFGWSTQPLTRMYSWLKPLKGGRCILGAFASPSLTSIINALLYGRTLLNSIGRREMHRKQLYCIALHCILLYCIVLCCVALRCVALYCIVLYCIVLHKEAIDCWLF